MNLEEKVVAIVGMGLMGGSLGKALINTKACREVRALVRRHEAAQNAISLGAAQIAGLDPAKILADADIVVLSTPVLMIEQQARDLAAYIKAGAVLTDMGSVKGNVVRAMENLPESIRPVGGHPMCGKEISGVESADPELFREKVWVLTPLKRTDDEALALIRDMTQKVGARPLIMDPELHDQVTACISHFPYLLSASLVAVAEAVAEDKPAVWDLASSGFRDTTRIAGGNVPMMLDILSANRKNVIAMLDKALIQIASFKEMLTTEDQAGLKETLLKVKNRRAPMFPK